MSAPETKHPEIEVQLVGQDGNAFNIMGLVSRALREAGFGSEVEAYTREAMSGDYDNLLRVSASWVTVY